MRLEAGQYGRGRCAETRGMIRRFEDQAKQALRDYLRLVPADDMSLQIGRASQPGAREPTRRSGRGAPRFAAFSRAEAAVSRATTPALTNHTS